jgi:hypothetical protein
MLARSPRKQTILLMPEKPVAASSGAARKSLGARGLRLSGRRKVQRSGRNSRDSGKETAVIGKNLAYRALVLTILKWSWRVARHSLLEPRRACRAVSTPRAIRTPTDIPTRGMWLLTNQPLAAPYRSSLRISEASVLNYKLPGQMGACRSCLSSRRQLLTQRNAGSWIASATAQSRYSVRVGRFGIRR